MTFLSMKKPKKKKASKESAAKKTSAEKKASKESAATKISGDKKTSKDNEAKRTSDKSQHTQSTHVLSVTDVPEPPPPPQPQLMKTPTVTAKNISSNSQHTPSTHVLSVNDSPYPQLTPNPSIAAKRISASSQLTQSTFSLSATDSPYPQLTPNASINDTLKAYGDIIERQDNNLAQKEDEIIQLRQEVSACQEQIAMLCNVVKQLEIDSTHKRINRKSRDESSLCSVEEWSQDLAPDEYLKDLDSDDDDVTVSTVHSFTGKSLHQPLRQRSISPLRQSIQSVRCKNSVVSRSRRSLRRDSYHSLQNSIHSAPVLSIPHDVFRSGTSLSGRADDCASVTSRRSQRSLHTVSICMKSLPREIELMEDEGNNDNQDKDDCSFYDDSCEKPESDARSVGSRRSLSRKSIVSAPRSRGRNSRRPLGCNDIRPPVSTDSLLVENKLIVDPCGEKGVYSGALSKSSGMPNGKGLMEYQNDKRWYEGDWVHGRWTGQGRLSNGEGDYYEGGLKNDRKHGKGITRFADGRVFEGKHSRGEMVEGKMSYQDGSVYRGSWFDGVRHGRGKCIFNDGSKYEGEFREGNFHGRGTLIWSDGGRYIGDWCNGEMHGMGKEIRPDGTVQHDGKWARGQPCPTP